eukprot:scaffold9668_cov35-Tisochrysis_lutea.AAC.7
MAAAREPRSIHLPSGVNSPVVVLTMRQLDFSSVPYVVSSSASSMAFPSPKAQHQRIPQCRESTQRQHDTNASRSTCILYSCPVHVEQAPAVADP